LLKCAFSNSAPAASTNLRSLITRRLPAVALAKAGRLSHLRASAGKPLLMNGNDFSV
jgi:hypothetical protein